LIILKNLNLTLIFKNRLIMPKIKVVSWKILIKFLNKNWFLELRQKGSHVVLINKNKDLITIVPIHWNKDLWQGLICDILKQSWIDIDYYNENI
jgi:predicted RNA binding protein YcfA (HicA-like mRNA interferase family)